MLFYAAGDDRAAAATGRLITACGFDPVRIGGVTQAGRIEAPGGGLHQNGGPGGKLPGTGQGHAVAAAY